MRKKCVLYTARGFVMECGHISPFYITPNVNALKTIDRFNAKTLYRDCPKCQRIFNREKRKDKTA